MKAFKFIRTLVISIAGVTANNRPHGRKLQQGIAAGRAHASLRRNIVKHRDRDRDRELGGIARRCKVEHVDFLGDGFCDPGYNNAECGWDLGDCCRSSCELNMITMATPNDCSGPIICKDPKAPEIKWPNCNVENPRFIGDGFCDDDGGYNTESCGYDGGDCCESTCQRSVLEDCSAPMVCRDPGANADPPIQRMHLYHLHVSNIPTDMVMNQTDGGIEDTPSAPTWDETMMRSNEELDKLDGILLIVAAPFIAMFLGLACWLRMQRTTSTSGSDGTIRGIEGYNGKGDSFRNKLRLSMSTLGVSTSSLVHEDDKDEFECVSRPPVGIKRASSASSQSSDPMAHIIDDPVLWKDFQDRLRENSCGIKASTREILRDFVKEKGLDSEEESKGFSLKPKSLLRAVSDSISGASSASSRSLERPGMGRAKSTAASWRIANLHDTEGGLPAERTKSQRALASLTAAFNLDKDMEEDNDILPAL